MGVIHFLNVNEGDCTWIEHSSGHNTVIDISNGKRDVELTEDAAESYVYSSVRGNYNQKAHPVDPIKVMNDAGVDSIFRFVLTHPDMDHMDGIKALFDNFDVYNFWDTANDKDIGSETSWGRYKKEDWDYYQKIRYSESNPKTLNLYAGAKGKYYNQSEDGSSGADGLYILAPTEELVREANDSGEYNDCSYVILYRTNGRRIIFGGDSAEKTWDYILENYSDEVADVDILIAPHHGRKTGGNREYLNVLRPKLTLFGNAKSQYLNYSDWNNRGLEHITNNQANCIILDTDCEEGISVYVTNEKFARDKNRYTFYSEKYMAWWIMDV